LCAKERWRGEIRVRTARQITAAVCRWQWSKRAISCDVRLGNVQPCIEQRGGNRGARDHGDV
jgi:hypothetical protein